MFFTQEDYRKIEKWLTANSRKDTDFVGAATPLKGNETVVLVQDGKNVKTSVKDIVDQFFLLGVSDFLNITDKYGESYISLTQAIQLIPFRGRKEGQVITFLNTDGNWEIYQFIGKLNQWNNPTLWNNPLDWEKFIIDSILPDEEDLTKSPADANGNSYLSLKDREYNPNEFSGLGRVILRKNIVEIDDPIYGKVTKNVLFQDMITQSNTIYEIRYDFDLNGVEITIPDNCTLDFKGGKLRNGKIRGHNILINAKEEQIFYNIVLGEPISIINSEIYLSWFVSPNTDCTEIVNRLFYRINSITLSKDTEYIVNSVINVGNNIHIKFNNGSKIIKNGNPDVPVFYIYGSYNSITSPSKSGYIKSNVPSYGGIIAIGEYGDVASNGMVTYNKIDGLRFEGVVSNEDSLSIGLLCKGTGINIGRYYNSVSNLFFRRFNIGIDIQGGFNANTIRDIQFDTVAGDWGEHTKRDNEAAIRMESLDTDPMVWGEVVENSISQVFHTASTNATTILMIGAVLYNTLTCINAEPGGLYASDFQYRTKVHEGEVKFPKKNVVMTAGLTMQGTSTGQDFINNNILISGGHSAIFLPKITSKDIIGENVTTKTLSINNRTINDNEDTWQGKYSATAIYNVRDGIFYSLGKILLNNNVDNTYFIKLVLANSSLVYNTVGSIFDIILLKKTDGSIEYSVSGHYNGNGFILCELIKTESNEVELVVRAPNFGVDWSSEVRITLEVYCKSNEKPFILNSTAVQYLGETNPLHFLQGGLSSNRPSLPQIGTSFYDKTLNKPIWWTGSTWVDATGASV